MHHAAKLCIGKDPFRVQDRLMDFGVNEYKNGVCTAFGTTSQ